MATNKLITVQQLDSAVDGFASAVAAAGYEKKANLKALAYVDEIADTHLASSITTVLAAKMTTARAQELVDKNVGKAYKPGGNATLATLPVADAAHFGYVYNMTEEFTTTDNFIEGAGKIFTAGSEVAIVEVEEVLAPGTYDASGNLLKSWAQLVSDGDATVTNGTIYGVNTTKFANVDKVVIDPSVTYIYDQAFYNCTGLTTIIIPDSVTSIDPHAFQGCTNLTTIYYSGTASDYPWGAYSATINPDIPVNITYKYNVLSGYIDTTKFAAQSSFATVKAAVENLSIASNSDIQALIDGLSLEEDVVLAAGSYDSNGNLLKSWDQLIADGDVTVTNGKMSTPSDRETRFANVKNIVIDSNVTSIGGEAFLDCPGLTSITIPDGVTSIESTAFSGCSGLTSITIPNGVTSIGEGAFVGCSGLTSITIPNSVTSIDTHAFGGCTGLTSITIPNSVTSIGYIAFSNCTGLTSITIPNSVTSIEGDAFDGCTNLTTIHYSGTATGAPWGADNATVVA